LKQEDAKLIRDITAAISDLLKDEIPPYLKLDETACREVRALSEVINRLIESVAESREFIKSLSQGKLDIDIPVANNFISPFKQLHANLKHLTWQTRRVADGDYHQQVDFLGDFSKAFNRMVAALQEKEKLEQALKKSEARYRSLYSAMNEGMALHEIITDDAENAVDYRILDINPAFEKIMEIERQTAVGKSGSELYGTAPPPYLDICAEVAHTGKPVSFEDYYFPLKKHFLISVISLTRDQFATIFSDISNLKRAEADRLRREKLQAVLETAGAICHELNQPLMAVSGYTELLEMDMGKDDPQYKRVLKLRESVNRMGTITQKLMKITRYKTRKYVGRTKIIDIHRSSSSDD